MSKTAVEKCLDEVEYKDGKLFWTKSGSGRKINKPIGSLTKDGYLQCTLGGVQKKVHHIVWFIHKGYWPESIDHINKIKDDNRIENLREGFSVNNHNRNMPLPSSGLVGAHYSKLKDKFKSSIKVEGSNIHLGYFDTAEEASRAYLKRKGEVLHG